MSGVARAALLWSCAVWIAGCGPGAEDDPIARLTPAEAAAARRTVVAWLECGDCRDGELEALVALGSVAVPSLASALEQGPSPAKRALLRRSAAETYRSLDAHVQAERGTGLPMDEAAYVEDAVARIASRYRSRAIAGLRAIGGPEATAILRHSAP